MLSKQTTSEEYLEIIIIYQKRVLRKRAQRTCYPSTEWPQIFHAC